MELIRKGFCSHCGKCCLCRIKTENGIILTPCQFYDTNSKRCLIYEWRPYPCREFPRNPEDIKRVNAENICTYYFIKEGEE